MEKLALSSIADGNTERRGACGGNLGNMKKNYICICLPIVPAFGKLLEKKKHKMTMCKIIHRSVISDRKKWENESNVHLIEDQ